MPWPLVKRCATRSCCSNAASTTQRVRVSRSIQSLDRSATHSRSSTMTASRPRAALRTTGDDCQRTGSHASQGRRAHLCRQGGAEQARSRSTSSTIDSLRCTACVLITRARCHVQLQDKNAELEDKLESSDRLAQQLESANRKVAQLQQQLSDSERIVQHLQTTVSRLELKLEEYVRADPAAGGTRAL